MKSALMKALFATAFAMVLGAISADAETLRVPQDFGTIQEAIDAAQAGDTVLIAAGTYNEELVIANFDANGDNDFDDAGDRDISNLTIQGAGPGQTILAVRSTLPPQDQLRFDVITAYEPRGISDPSWGNPRGIRLRADQGNGSNYTNNSAHFTAAGGEENAGRLNGVTIRDLTVENSYVGIQTSGYVTNFDIDNVEIKNSYYGFYSTNGVGGTIQNSMFENNKFQIGFGDGAGDINVLNNEIVLDNNVASTWEEEGNWFFAVLIGSGSGTDEPYDIQIAGNQIDYSGYTRGRGTGGFSVAGGRDHKFERNAIDSVVYAFNMYDVSWYRPADNVSTIDNLINNVYFPMAMDPVRNATIERMDLTGNAFRAFSTSPWETTTVPGVGSAIHSGCAASGGEASVSRTFDVPATGATVLDVSHFFSTSFNELFLEVQVDGTEEWVVLAQSLGNGDSANRQWFGPVGQTTSKHPWGGDCSGYDFDVPKTYTAPQTQTGNNYTRPEPYNGRTNGAGVIADSVDLSAYAGDRITVRFRHELSDKPAFDCVIEGNTDLCGWYISDFQITNDASGAATVVNDVNSAPLDGITLSDWDSDVSNSTYALYVGGRGDHPCCDEDGELLNLTVKDSKFSNPHGDGIVWADNTPATIRLNDNEFAGNRDIALNISSNVVPPTVIDATNNWWGSNDGPRFLDVNGTIQGFGTGDVIRDLNDVVNENPFVSSFIDNVTAASLPSVMTQDAIAAQPPFQPGQPAGRWNCASSDYTITFSILQSDLSLVTVGELACSGSGAPTYTDSPAAPASGALVVTVTGTNVPDVNLGDFLTATFGGVATEVFLPGDDALYASSVNLYVSSSGETYYTCTAADRNCAPGDAAFISFDTAVATGEVAAEIGSIEYPLEETASSDFNWVGLPHFRVDVSTAGQLWDAIDAQNGVPIVRTMSRWNAVSQTYTQYVRVPFEFGNFDVNVGDAYRLEVQADASYEYVGAEPESNSLTYSLITTQGSNFNWLSLPWYKTDLLFASDLAADINADSQGGNVVSTINQWDAASQTLVQYIPGLPFGDFDVSRGVPYRIEVSQNVVYTPTVSPVTLRASN